MGGHAGGGGVGAVGRAEGVVDVDVREFGQLLSELGVVGGFAGKEANVFQEEELTGLQGLGGRFDFGPDGLAEENHLLFEEFSEPLGDGGEGKGVIGLALGPAEVGSQDQTSAALQEVLQCWQAGADPGVVGDRPVLKRDVVVDTDQDSFPLGVEITKAELGHQGDATLSLCLS